MMLDTLKKLIPEGGLKRGQLCVITAPPPLSVITRPLPLRTPSGKIIHLTLEQ